MNFNYEEYLIEDEVDGYEACCYVADCSECNPYPEWEEEQCQEQN